MTQKLDPRSVHVYLISAPTEKEHGTHYLFRFMKNLPAPGSIAIFDRSWYGRVLVERVEEFATENEVVRAYDEINAFEKMLRDDGVVLIKIFLYITKDEQIRRFRERLTEPLKHWKLTEEDMRNQARWPDYEIAIGDMLEKPHTADIPWHVVPANRKWYCRINVLNYIVDQLSDGVDLTLP